MATPSTPAIDASTRLLRVVGLLLPHLDPVKGGKAKALGPVVNDLQELLDEGSLGLPAAVQSLVSSAVASLSSNTPTILYSDCLTALSAITSALPLLVAPSSPPLPSPFSHLPAELVARVVDFCQDEDLRLRQNTNLALSRTCRALYAAVRPIILRREVHLFTAAQLERVAEKVKADDDFRRGICQLTTQLELPEISEQKDGTWAGRHLVPLVEALAESPSFAALQLHFRDSSGCEGGTSTFEAELLHALGLEGDDWWDFGVYTLEKVPSLVLPSPNFSHAWTFAVRVLLRPGTKVERLELGSTRFPYAVDPLDLDLVRARHGLLGRLPPSFSQLRSLVLPFFTLRPHNLALLAPADALSPPLERLELAIHLETPDAEEGQLIEAFLSRLAPSLRHLSLRQRGEPPGGGDEYAKMLQGALGSCTLTTFELGGTFLCDLDFVEIACCISSLRRLVVLPTPDSRFFSPAGLAMVEPSLPSYLETLTLCTPDRRTRSAGDAWGSRAMRRMFEMCARSGIELKLEERQAEFSALTEE
ncbi:hypothetical protein JCM10213_006608 [Rhodosporidiobolus nylandii]